MKIRVKVSSRTRRVDGDGAYWHIEILPFLSVFHGMDCDGETTSYCVGFGWLFWSCSIWIWPKGVSNNTRED